ncbi:MAG: bifunctional [glutamate--ammonia ligase]-adenylyl-L-tyrosine phosphorylase/[glutamate--ammonia-ligase] adenylyltransferase [Magnetococcales bacterium]|nr:bifunctional [glutamate--ammonia ligase]-adenylyl-L-tyrosine phosphorylase/[glutamate--ammonia-ligase] adenylyltransferase [Magnetococcales bacterium]
MDRLGDGLDEMTRRDLAALAALTAEPEAAPSRLAAWRDACLEDPALTGLPARLLGDAAWRKRLVLGFGHSPYLALAASRWPGVLAELAQPGGLNPPDEAYRAAFLAQAEGWKDFAQAARGLRLHKHREYLRIGLLDLAGELPLMEVTRSLAGVADLCLDGGIRWLTRQMAPRHGLPMVQLGEESRPARFVVLAMGKHGARELNFSSDIDLIYLYDEDEGRSDGPQPLPLKQYYSRLGKELMRLMQEPTAEGQVFRVDMRLRPEGESGDLCLSCRSAEIYYESWGQSWERAVMIKARPAAGDLALGEAFLAKLTPFVYRRYLDFAALDALREMKRRIDRKTAQAGHVRRNVKLGYGGIREIEFFVQSQQLIHGGKQPRLRQRETLATLRELQALGLVERENADFLEEAYVYLRTVEHRLQIERTAQTHLVPEDPAAFAQLARRMGEMDPERFRRRLARVQDGVYALYRRLFHQAEEEAREVADPKVEALLGCDLDAEEGRRVMEAAGLFHLDHARALLGALRLGTVGVPMTESNRRWFDRLAPLLLTEILAAPDPEMAVTHAEEFIRRVGRRTSYLALMVENPRVVRLLARLFGSSALLSRFLNRHPDLIDRLIAPEFLEGHRSRNDMGAELVSALAAARDADDWHRVIRDFKNIELLRLALRDLMGLAELPEAMAGLSALADVILTQVMVDALDYATRRHGSPAWSDEQGQRHPAPFAVVAMGKLGGDELNYASDLDLLFIHGSEGSEPWTEKDNLSNGAFFARVGQRMVTAITTPTASGKLYDLDMRLRPSGNSGPLVIGFQAFSHYQRHEAWTWEHQALTRARVVAGEPAFAARIQEEIRTIVTLPRDPETVRREVAEMRQRMFKEKHPPEGVVDIKQSRGGIVDIEFLAQYLILAHAHALPRIVQRNTGRALNAFRQAGLLSPEEFAVLDEAYGFYRLVENRLRLLLDRSENRIDANPRLRKRLGRLCGLEESGEIVAEVEKRLVAVRPIVQSRLESASG